MRFVTLTATVWIAGTAAASAAGLNITSFTSDAAFNAICQLGTANNQECENAVAEFRGGNGNTSGTFEQSLNTPTQFGAVQAQYAWGNGVAEDFDLVYDGAGTISLSLGSVPQTITMPNPTGSYVGLGTSNTMFIRIRNEASDAVISLTGMSLDGMAVGNLVFGQSMDDMTNVGAGSSGAGYLRISDYDFSQAWSLTGQVALSWTGSIPSNSRLDANFKLTTIPEAAVPLPAGVVLLGSALAGVAGLRRLRTVA